MSFHTCLEHPKFLCPGCKGDEEMAAYVVKLETFIKNVGKAPRQSLMKQAKAILAERPK